VTRVTINPVRPRAEKPQPSTPQPRLSRRPMVFAD
jgi:DNA polymerase-3 subunit epsilon